MLSLEKKYEACHEIGNTNVLLTKNCERRDQQSLIGENALNVLEI